MYSTYALVISVFRAQTALSTVHQPDQTHLSVHKGATLPKRLQNFSTRVSDGLSAALVKWVRKVRSFIQVICSCLKKDDMELGKEWILLAVMIGFSLFSYRLGNIDLVFVSDELMQSMFLECMKIFYQWHTPGR